MSAKITNPEKDHVNFNRPIVPGKSFPDDENIESTKKKVYQRTTSRRSVKLPRLKLADLVSQVTEENAHSEISTGQAVGNEAW